MNTIKITFDQSGRAEKNTYPGLVQSDNLTNRLELRIPLSLGDWRQEDGTAISPIASIYLKRPDNQTFRYGAIDATEDCTVEDGYLCASILLDHQACGQPGTLDATVSLSALYGPYTTADTSSQEIAANSLAVKNLFPFHLLVERGVYTAEPDSAIGGEVDSISSFDVRISRNEHAIDDLTITSSDHEARITAGEAGISNLVTLDAAKTEALARIEPQLAEVAARSAETKACLADHTAAYQRFMSDDYFYTKDRSEINESAIVYHMRLITGLTVTVDDNLAAAKSYTDLQIGSLIGGAPQTLDTLKELSDALLANDGDTAKALAAIADNKVRLAALESTSTDHDFRIPVLESQCSTTATELSAAKDRLTAVEMVDVAQSAALDQLAERGAALAERTQNVEKVQDSHTAALADHDDRIGSNTGKIDQLIKDGLSNEASRAANKRMDGIDLDVEALGERALNLETVNVSQTADISTAGRRLDSLEAAKADNTLYTLPSDPSFAKVSLKELLATSADGVVEFAANYIDLKPKGSSADYTLRLAVPSGGSYTLTANSSGAIATTSYVQSQAASALNSAKSYANGLGGFLQDFDKQTIAYEDSAIVTFPASDLWLSASGGSDSRWSIPSFSGMSYLYSASSMSIKNEFLTTLRLELSALIHVRPIPFGNGAYTPIEIYNSSGLLLYWGSAAGVIGDNGQVSSDYLQIYKKGRV